jgi:hypothetical protein
MSGNGTLSWSGASALAAKIENYWRARGYDSVKAEVFASVCKDEKIYVVRSNLGRDKKAAANAAARGGSSDPCGYGGGPAWYR